MLAKKKNCREFSGFREIYSHFTPSRYGSTSSIPLVSKSRNLEFSL